MTFKRPEIDKILRNGLSMIEMNPLSHKWFDFAIYLGLALHQLKKKAVKNTDCMKISALSVSCLWNRARNFWFFFPLTLVLSISSHY